MTIGDIYEFSGHHKATMRMLYNIIMEDKAAGKKLNKWVREYADMVIPYSFINLDEILYTISLVNRGVKCNDVPAGLKGKFYSYKTKFIRRGIEMHLFDKVEFHEDSNCYLFTKGQHEFHQPKQQVCRDLSEYGYELNNAVIEEGHRRPLEHFNMENYKKAMIAIICYFMWPEIAKQTGMVTNPLSRQTFSDEHPYPARVRIIDPKDIRLYGQI